MTTMTLTSEQQQMIDKIELREHIHTIVPYNSGAIIAFTDDDAAFIYSDGSVDWESTVQ